MKKNTNPDPVTYVVSAAKGTRGGITALFLVKSRTIVGARAEAKARLDRSGVVYRRFDVVPENESSKTPEQRAANRVAFGVPGDDWFIDEDDELHAKLGVSSDRLTNCPEPGRTFAIGDKLYDGKTVTKVFKSGKFYEVSWTYKRNKAYSAELETVTENVLRAWYELYPMESFPKEAPINGDNFIARISQSMQSSLDIAWNMVLRDGVNMNPDYQRGSVWGLEDKVKLIESLFQHREIGTFVFRRLGMEGWKNGVSYEIVDGKQRLEAIVDFRLGKFKVYGRYYHEMNPEDLHTLRNNMFRYSVINEDVPLKKIIEMFVLLNTTGKPMDPAVIEKAKEMLKELP